MRAWADVAELTKVKSLEGGLVARSAAGLPFLLRPGIEVAFVPPQIDAPRRAHVACAQQEAKGGYFVRFDEVNSIDVAERLVSCHCLVRRADLPAAALVACEVKTWEGFAVTDAQAGHIGTVEDVVESPGQMLLQVARDEGGRCVLIPLVEALVVGVDEEARRIDVDLPDGLLKL